MKLTVERSVFLKALGHVQSVVEKRNTIPILSNVLVQAEGKTVTLTATDLDIEISEELPADIEAEGAITISASTIYEIVRKLPDGAQILLDTAQEANRVSLTAEKSTFALATLPDRDFPSLSVDDGGTTFTLPAADLKRLIDKTRFAMSYEETRYYLNGIYAHVMAGGPTLRAVTTDGHRLACVDVGLPEGAENMPGIIIPRKTVGELLRLLDNVEENIEISVSNTKIIFSFAKIMLVSKLIDGTFPDYARVIPDGNDRVLAIDPAEFTRAVDRVSTISADKTRSVKLMLETDHLALTVNNPDAGHAHEEIVMRYDSEPMEIGFNAKYLLDVAGQIDGKEVTFKFADSSSPAVIIDEEDPDALYVLMPLRV